MDDLHSRLLPVSAIDIATIAADNTPASIDLQGYDSAEIVILVGIGGITFSTSNKIEFTLTHSDDNVTFANVADKDLLGISGTTGGIIKSLIAAHAAATVSRFGYKGGKRYLQLLAHFSGTHGTGTPIAALVVKGDGYNGPEANQL